MGKQALVRSNRYRSDLTFVAESEPTFGSPESFECESEEALKHRHWTQQADDGWSLPAGPGEAPMATFGTFVRSWKDAKNFDGCWRALDGAEAGRYLLFEAKGYLAGGSKDERNVGHIIAKLNDWVRLVAAADQVDANRLMWKRLTRKGRRLRQLPANLTQDTWLALPAHSAGGADIVLVCSGITTAAWRALRGWFDEPSNGKHFRRAELWVLRTPLARPPFPTTVAHVVPLLAGSGRPSA